MATTSISITPQFGNNSVIAINCGTSSPKLGGTIDLSSFPHLQDFKCISNDITALSGYADNSNLRDFRCDNNQLTGSISSLSGLTNLEFFRCFNNQLTGPIPSLSSLINLRNFRCDNNQLTGSISSLAGLTNLEVFYCQQNQITGSIPSLIGLTNLRDFQCHTNQLTGSIPSLAGLTNLQIFNCVNQAGLTKLTGSIPSLAGLTNLQEFRCVNNKITGFAGASVSDTLGTFEAQNNQLNQSSINAILSAFVVANRTTDTRILDVGGSGNAAPSYTGGVTTTSAGTNFTRSGTLVTVTDNITPHGHVNGDIVTVTGIGPTTPSPAPFQGTFVVTRINDNQFQYTTLSSGTATGTGTATMRKTSDAASGYASYQNLALVSRTGGPWTITINQP